MPNTDLLHTIDYDVDPSQSEIGPLDVSAYRTIRLSVGNSEGSPGPVTIFISHVNGPNTPDAQLISVLDSFTVSPDEWVSKVYEVPGQVIVFLARPQWAPLSGIQITMTVYGWTD
jgi:hypothetical protein